MNEANGGREWVSEAIPMDRDTLFAYLAKYKSLREVAIRISEDLKRKISHQSIMDVLSKDKKYQQVLVESERIFAMNWPLSATEKGYVVYPFVHNSLRRRLEEVLFRHRFKDGWPAAEALAGIFLERYQRDRWERKTPHWELLRAAGVPSHLEEMVFERMRRHLRKHP